MTTQTLWRWKPDGKGGDNGTATYFPGSEHEITVPLPDFTTASALYNRIYEQIMAARYDARASLLAQIGRIQP